MSDNIIKFNFSALKKLPSFEYALAAIRHLSDPHNNKLSKIHEHKVQIALNATPRECFMQNSKAFLANRAMATRQDMLVYVTLLSRRDSLEYKLYGKTALPTCLAFGFDLTKLKRNKLLNVTESNIYFKYEEQ